MTDQSRPLVSRRSLLAAVAIGGMTASAATLAQQAGARTLSKPTGPRITAQPLPETSAYQDATGKSPIALADNDVKGKVTPLGRVIDFATTPPSAKAVKAAGYVGAIRYVSQPRKPQLTGKPLKKKETKDYQNHGLWIASVFQYLGSDNPDWKGGASAGKANAKEAIAIHEAAGGPKNKPIYAAIDSNPSLAEYNSLIAPYLQAFSETLHNNGYELGVYGNYYTLDWCYEDSIGTYFWQHDWGSNGKLHKNANIHQLPAGYHARVESTTVDVNEILKSDWGQWQPR